MLGIAGLIGAGRTELLRAIFGLDRRAHRASIRVEGARSAPPRPRQQWARGVGMVSEDRKTEGLALSLSIADNLTLSSLGRASSARRRRPTPAGSGSRSSASAAASPEQPVGDLSGGNQQKVALARLLHHGVDVLLLDEPTRGIDVGSKAQIYQLIDDSPSRARPC